MNGDPPDAGARNQIAFAVHTTFCLRIARLGGLGERKGGGEEENEGENLFHYNIIDYFLKIISLSESGGQMVSSHNGMEAEMGYLTRCADNGIVNETVPLLSDCTVRPSMFTSTP
ncbi:MAG: hypothetical protein IKD78_00800, partial [Bacteroidales bacterium]|nr:hypothetical protein [Bacteroidales bacterium]